jgi:multidrug resistance efflux pump
VNGTAPQSNHRPIPTPLRVRWVRFRHQLLPVLTVILCSLVTVWLWMRHAGAGNAVGEVAADRIPITSNVDGVLAQLPGRVINPHDRVKEGDEIARLDPAPIEARRALRAAEADRLRGEVRALEQATGPDAAARDAQLKSLRTALTAREEEIAQLDLTLTSLDITAPVSGTVFRVYLRPGQLARAGDIIMEISADGSNYVVSYLREEQQYIKPRPNMAVDVRPRNDPRRVVSGTVDTVGATVEPVPARQLRDQKIPEWGLPVRLTIPPDANLRPGEIVNLAFKPTAP